MYNIYDNFLTKSYHKEIKDILTSADFPWFYISNISDDTDTREFKDEYGFFHLLINDKGQSNSNYTSFFKPMLYQIMDITNTNKILKARCDMTTNKGVEKVHDTHIDFPNQTTNKSVIFYVNETDGDTILYNERYTDDFKNKTQTIMKKVEPKENRLLTFEGDLLHTGSSPINYANRILINCNFI